MNGLERLKSRVGKAKLLQVLDKKDENPFVVDLLETGNELCRGRMIPMSPQLIAKVKSIYEKIMLELQRYDMIKSTPVFDASIFGYADMVWGFIQCSKQTQTNLHTRRRSKEPLDFLWIRDDWKRTALDWAIIRGKDEVAKVLLSAARRSDLESAWESHGKFLLPLLHDFPQHDGFIFEKLEEDLKRRRREFQLGEKEADLILDVEEYFSQWNYEIEKTKKRVEKRQKYLEKLNDQGLLPNKNTILHFIVSEFDDVNTVKDILEKDHSLVSSRNSEGETPVYVAAREGHLGVLQFMLNHLKENNEDVKRHLIRRKDEHNALHIAIQNHHAQVVFMLLEEIPQLANQENVSKESPLYLAAERSYFAIVEQILKKCGDETNFTGPNGKTALHAAAISNSAECVENLLAQRSDLLNKKDENDLTPFHYVVHYNSSLAMERFLNVDPSIGYQSVTQDDTVISALHMAASRGHCEAMKVLIRDCPGSSEFIDSKGRNILHVAIESQQTEVIEFIFQHESLTSLINQKDNNGNTPAHLLAASNFETMQKVIDFRVNIHSLNNENRTPLDMIASDKNKETLIKAIAMGTTMSIKRNLSSPNISTNGFYEEELNDKQEKTEARFKMVDNMVLVVTLIATATFAAAFTVPGGFDSDNGSKQGTPYLLKKAAFQAFVITNAIAFSCSCSVLLAHIYLLIYRNRYDESTYMEREYIDRRIVIMYYLTGIALLAMLIAIVTGFYVVLLPSLWLAIFVCVLSISIVVVSVFV